MNKIKQISRSILITLIILAFTGAAFYSYYYSVNQVIQRSSKNVFKMVSYSSNGGVISEGSCFSIPNGYIVSNYHVIKDGKVIVIANATYGKFEVELIGFHAEADLALLKIKGDYEGIRGLNFKKHKSIRLAEEVFAIGYPGNFGKTVSKGIISGKRQYTVSMDQIKDFFQTDAFINSGNSGGPLIDKRGRIVGINHSVSNDYSGINFAVTGRLAQLILKELKSEGVFVNILGVVESIFFSTYQDNSTQQLEGCLVDEIRISKTGNNSQQLQKEDIILSINGNPTPYISVLFSELLFNTDKLISIKIQRGSTIKYLKLDLRKENNRPEYISKKAVSFQQQRNLKSAFKAILEYENINKDNTSLTTYYSSYIWVKSMILSATGKTDSARKLLDAEIKKNSKYALLYMLRGATYLNNTNGLDEYKKAGKDFYKAINLFEKMDKDELEGELNSGHYANAYAQRGLVNHKLGLLKRSAYDFKKSIDIRILKGGQQHLYLGKVLNALAIKNREDVFNGYYEEAIKYLFLALKQGQENNPIIYELLGDIAVNYHNEKFKAKMYYNKALKISPYNHKIKEKLNNLG
jgi:S1-C subfamily serine protease